MKRIALLITMVLIGFTSFAGPSESDSKTEKEPGIQFHKGNWKEALQKAEKESKSGEAKCGEGKCGEGEKAEGKKSEAQKESKSGEGKCGE